MKRFATFIIINLLLQTLAGQVNRFGVPVMKSYSMQVTQGSEYNWSITKDIFGSVYLGNDYNMVLRYDGTGWTSIPIRKNTSTIVRALGSDKKGIIYVGGADEFGYIQPDSTGKRAYVSVSDRLSKPGYLIGTYSGTPAAWRSVPASDLVIGDIFSLVVTDPKIYFISNRSLIIYNSISDSIDFVNLRELGFRQTVRIYSVNERIIFADNNKGLFEFAEGQVKQLPGGDFFSSKQCLSVLPYSDNELIVGTMDAGVFLYNFAEGTVNSSFIDKDVFIRLKESQLYCGVRLSSGEIVYGTISDGIFVFDSNGKNTGHWNTRNSDMQDNVVTALYSDPDVNSELWIATFGNITKAYVNLPFTHFSSKSGIEGGVNSISFFNKSVYVGTDQGVFHSTSAEDGTRIFKRANNISTQVFPLCSASVGSENFLLAGSLEGVHFVKSDGYSYILKGDRIDAENRIDKGDFTARVILQSKINRNRFYFGLNTLGIKILDYVNSRWKYVESITSLKGTVLFINELENGDIIALENYPDGLYRITPGDTLPVKYGPEKGIPEVNLNNLSEINGDLFLTTGTGIFKFDKAEDNWSLYEDKEGEVAENKETSIYFSDNDNDRWITLNEDRYNDILITNSADSIITYKGGLLSLLPNVKLVYVNTIEGRSWLAKSNSIYIIDKEKLKSELPHVQTLLSRVVIKSRSADSVIMEETFFNKDINDRRFPVSSDPSKKVPEFSFNFNSTSFYWTTPYMIDEESTQYSFKLDGYEKEWSKWNRTGYKDYTNLSFGRYTFRVKAKTATGIESEEAVYSFIILRPWYLTAWMIILYGIGIFFLVYAIIKAYTRRLKNENIRLEGIVAERTAEVVKQKEELESSIHYASRIQMALLPSETILSENLKNYFILFRPRDIVSGDFYWMTKKGERLYIVAADCTGHGVPGAFMSLLGMSFLDEIIEKELAPKANFILSQLRHHVTESLKQVGEDDEAKDGMDIALLVIDFNTNIIEFSGAYNPCFRVRKLNESEIKNYRNDLAETPEGTLSNGKYILETINASKMPIGISSRMNEEFDFYEWTLEKGVSYYLFSDGYVDQFGGPHGRKFMKKNFKRLLLDIQDYPMVKQKELLEKNLKDWMGESPQIDDILVMGIRTD